MSGRPSAMRRPAGSLTDGREDKRATYFAFQGLLMAVLLLIFLYQYKDVEGWVERLLFLLLALTSSLLLIRLVNSRILVRWWFQAALFIGDAMLASLTLHWTEPRSDLYLIYFLIIFGTALTRNFVQSFIVAVVTTVLYMVSAWHPVHGFPHDTAFWLRVNFLLVSSSLLAILSRDTNSAQADQEQLYQERLVKMESLATLGQVAGEVAHRIKGPLTTIMVNSEVLAHRYQKSKDMLKELQEIQQEVGHCKEILKGLLDLGRIEEMDFSPVDLREPIRNALASVEPQARRFGIRVESSPMEEPLRVLGDQSLLQEAVSAVLQNALDATRWRGRVRLSVIEAVSRFRFTRPEPGAGSYLIVIEDDGKGIAPADLERIFRPFFTTKGREGSGLGLSAALRIMQKHNGTVEAYSDGPGRGARFTLSLPKAPTVRAARSPGRGGPGARA